MIDQQTATEVENGIRQVTEQLRRNGPERATHGERPQAPLHGLTGTDAMENQLMIEHLITQAWILAVQGVRGQPFPSKEDTRKLKMALETIGQVGEA